MRKAGVTSSCPASRGSASYGLLRRAPLCAFASLNSHCAEGTRRIDVIDSDHQLANTMNPWLSSHPPCNRSQARFRMPGTVLPMDASGLESERRDGAGVLGDIQG